MSATTDDEVLNWADLKLLVKDAVFGAVDGDEDTKQAPPADTVVVAGSGAKLAIKHAVAESVRELIANQTLLAGPLKEEAERLLKVSAEAEDLWKTLKSIEESLDKSPETTAAHANSTVVGSEADRHVEVVKIDFEPSSPQTTVAVGAEADQRGEIVKIDQVFASTTNGVTVGAEADMHDGLAVGKEPAPASEPKAAKPRAPKRPEESDEPEDSGLVVDGLKIFFKKGTKEPFKAFIREFVPTILKGPVSPQYAGRLAQKHGWNVWPGTVRAQADSYLGTLSVGKDKQGNSWWWLPGHPGPDVATEKTK